MQPRIFPVILMCLLLTFSTLGVASCSTDTSGRQSFSQDVQDKLNKAVDAKMAEFGVPGVIVGVWVPGKGEWISCKGVSDIKTGTGPTIYDHVRIASITKTFTATVILQLIDEKMLTLEDTLDKFDLGVTVPDRKSVV